MVLYLLSGLFLSLNVSIDIAPKGCFIYTYVFVLLGY